MIGKRSGGGLLVVNLENLLEDGIPATSEAVTELVCGRRSGKSGQAFFRARSLPFGMEKGSISGKTLSVAGWLCV